MNFNVENLIVVSRISYTTPILIILWHNISFRYRYADGLSLSKFSTLYFMRTVGSMLNYVWFFPVELWNCAYFKNSQVTKLLAAKA